MTDYDGWVSVIPKGTLIHWDESGDICNRDSHVFRPAIMDGEEREVLCACGKYSVLERCSENGGSLRMLKER